MHVAVEDVFLDICNDEIAALITETDDQPHDVHDKLIANDLPYDRSGAMNLGITTHFKNFNHDREPTFSDAAFNQSEGHIHAFPEKGSSIVGDRI